MSGLLRALRVLGPSHLWKLRTARKWGTPIARGFFATRVIQSLFNIGFMDELFISGNISLSTYASQHNYDLRILRLLCDYLYALEFLEKKQGDCYCMGRKGRMLNEVLRGTFDTVYAYEDLLHNLEALITKEKAYEKGVKRRAEFVGKGSGQSSSLLPFPMAIDLIRKNGFSTILDLGCGDGEFLIGLSKRQPSMRGWGVDLSPEVVALATRRILQERLEDRIKVVVGDIFNLRDIRDRVGTPDAATLFNVLHEFLGNGRQKVVDLLRQFCNAFPGISLIVCEITRLFPEDFRKKPTILLEHHLFHDLSQQGLIPRNEWRRIFLEAGLHLVEEMRLDFAEMSIFHMKQGN